MVICAYVVPSLLQRHQPALAIDAQGLAGSASWEQVGEAAATRGASVMTGSLEVRIAWGSRCSNAEHRDIDMSMSDNGRILPAKLMAIY